MVAKLKIEARDIRVDIIKAIGIILMVCGHSGVPFRSFIYLFHMAVFFIASGYCFKSHNSDDGTSVLRFTIRKFRGLWIPYVMTTGIYSLLHNVFIRVNIYTNNADILGYLAADEITLTEFWTLEQIALNILKGLLLHGHTQLGSALWFVATLMEISILYCVVDYIIKKCFGKSGVEFCQLLVSILLLAFGSLMATRSIEWGGVNRVFSYYSLFHLGVEIKGHQDKFFLLIRRYGVWVGLGSFGFLFMLQNNMVELDQNQYVDPFFLIFTSLLGWMLLFTIADLISKFGWLKKAVVCLGQNTLSVVIGHFLCFKLVNLAGVLIKGLPYYCIAAFPVLFYGGCVWVIYTIVGTAVPVLLQLAVKKIIGFS